MQTFINTTAVLDPLFMQPQARNVLLGTGMVCKVADFGLSRRVQTEDNTGDYYRRYCGSLPVTSVQRFHLSLLQAAMF